MRNLKEPGAAVGAVMAGAVAEMAAGEMVLGGTDHRGKAGSVSKGPEKRCVPRDPLEKRDRPGRPGLLVTDAETGGGDEMEDRSRSAPLPWSTKQRESSSLKTVWNLHPTAGRSRPKARKLPLPLPLWGPVAEAADEGLTTKGLVR